MFRVTVDGLIESLDAVARLTEWGESEAKPEPLLAAASQLQVRLGTANRLAASRFNGPAADLATVTKLCDAMRQLDTAFLTFCKARELPSHSSGAAGALASEIATIANAL